MVRMLTVLVSALCLALAACGSSRPAAPTGDGARAALHSFASALEQSRFSDACAMLTPQAQARVGGGSSSACPARLALARQLVSADRWKAAAEQASSAPVTVNGSTATVSAANGQTTMYFRGGRWLIGQTG